MNMRTSLPREWHGLLDAAHAAGWTVEKTRNNHVKWQSPSGAVVFSASTPSDVRAIKNIRSMLRRKGLAI